MRHVVTTWRIAGLAVALGFAPATGQGSDFTIPEAKLLDGEFAATCFGPAVIAVRLDGPGRSVEFTFSGLDAAGSGVKDDYPVDTVYGQNVPSHGNGDFSIFSGYVLRVENLDSDAVWFSLFLNTGFTGPSGDPPNTPANDTFWHSPWTAVLPGGTEILRLDFNNAIPWNIADNPPPHTQGSNGEATSINDYDRTEVSAIGFQIAVFSPNPDATVLVSPACPGDLNGDGARDVTDFTLFAAAFGSQVGDPNYNPAADLNADGFINVTDFSEFAAVFGTACP